MLFFKTLTLTAAILLVAHVGARAQTPFPPPQPSPNPGPLPSPSGQGVVPQTLAYTTQTQLTTLAARAPKGPLQITLGGGPVATFLARRHVFTISHQAFVPVVTPAIQQVQYQAVVQPQIQYVVPVQVQVPVQPTFQAPPPPAKGSPQAAAFSYAPTFNAAQPTAQPVYMQAVPGKPGLFRLCNPAGIPTSSNDEAAPDAPQVGSTATN